MMGSLVGLFAVGRPFPVFREFMTYAATAESPTYGAAVMVIHGLGQITILLVLFFILVYFFGKRMVNWAQTQPYQPRLVTALADRKSTRLNSSHVAISYAVFSLK